MTKKKRTSIANQAKKNTPTSPAKKKKNCFKKTQIATNIGKRHWQITTHLPAAHKTKHNPT
ncbi:hypothetical protein, partial [Raoultella ornithinolytica]|uniref:hypothetical protein n=1 Tax=Raoultella ornithinolytica TaxID=54291 RepID=UPI001951D241